MENPLLLSFDCSEILDNAVKDIFKRVVRFDMEQIHKCPMNTHELYSLVISTQGDYNLTIVLCAENDVFRKMAEHMKRGAPPGDEDIPVYVTEFYNILCGHIVSMLNKTHHCSARFAIPKYIRGYYMTVKKEQSLCSYFYDCGYGMIQIETLFY